MEQRVILCHTALTWPHHYHPQPPAQLYLGAALFSLLTPTHSDEAAVFMPHLLVLWCNKCVESSLEWDMLFMLLLKRLAKDIFTGRAAPIDFHPVLEVVFTRTLLLLNLPGGAGPVSPKGANFSSAAYALIPSSLPGPIATIRAAARIIVLALPPIPRTSPDHAPSPGLLLAADGYGLEAAEATAAVEAAAEAETAVEKECAAEAGSANDGAEKVQHRFPPISCAGAWTRLRQLLRCVEPYCHPSNSGPWAAYIGYLLQALSQYTSCRVLLESSGLAADPSHHLAPGDVSVLVRLLLPLATQALYSKGGQLMRMAQMSCRYLCELTPELALNSTMLKLCEGLQAVTAVHQTPMALSSLALLVATLVDLTTAPGHALCAEPARPSLAARLALASGPRVLHEAMQLALPGIDPNDVDKLAGSLRFFEQVFLALPLAGACFTPLDDEPTGPMHLARLSSEAACLTERALDAHLDGIGVYARRHTLARLAEQAMGDGAAESRAAADTLQALDEQETDAASMCAWLPDFAAELLARLVHALEHLDKTNESHVSLHQALSLMQWRRTVTLFFQQLSEEVFASLLPTVLSLLARTSLLDPIKQVGAIISAAVLANPRAVLSRAIPTCVASLLGSWREGAGKPPLLQSLSDIELQWWLLVLSHLVRNAGPALLPHMSVLTTVLDLTSAHTDYKVAKCASKLRRRLLQSLLSHYHTETRSLPPRAWRSAGVRAKQTHSWGWRPPLEPASARADGVAPSWHVPSGPEIDAASGLVAACLDRAERLSARLKEAGQGYQPTEDHVRDVLLELRAVAKGAVPYLLDEPSGGIASGSMLDEAPSLLDEPAVAAETPPTDGLLSGAASGRPGSLPKLSSARGAAGLLSFSSACKRPVSRLARVLREIGDLVSPREAVRNTLLLLRVVALTVSDRSSPASLVTQQQLLHVTRRTCSLRGGGRPKRQPRANLLTKLHLRHASRLAATGYAAAWRTPALLPLIQMQLGLSTHPYASVRASAQAGFGSALRKHPWLARTCVPSHISLLRSPDAAYHETKGAIFMLGSRAVLRRIATDWPLLCSTLISLCDAPDHARPKLQQRCRNLFSHVLEQSALQVHFDDKRLAALTPLMVLHAASRAAPEIAIDTLRRYYASTAAREAAACSLAVDELLSRLQVDSKPGGGRPARVETPASIGESDKAIPGGVDAAGPQLATHWSREVGALCALVIVPIEAASQRAAFAEGVARGLCSATAAVRRLSRAALSMVLSRPRPRGTAVLVPCAPPPDIFAALPSTDAEWEACELRDKLLSGWSSNATYVAPSRDTDPRATVAPLGAEADRLLTDATFLRQVLEWLVTDHAEADSAPGGHEARSVFKQPHDVVCSGLAAGRRWPSLPSHGCEFRNVVFTYAQLFKGLAAHYGAAALLPSLLPVILEHAAEQRRDSQAVAAESLAGLLRGSGHWPLSEQRQLWEAVGPPLRATLRACSVQSLGDWQISLRFVCHNRDPRRLQWLAKLLLDEAERAFHKTTAAAEPPPGAAHAAETDAILKPATGALAETSLAQANVLRFLAPLLIELSWRGLPLVRRLLRGDFLLKWATHAYKQVREEVGSLLAIVMDAATPSPTAAPDVGRALFEETAAFTGHLLAACKAPLITAPCEGLVPRPCIDGELLLEPEDEDEKQQARAARETIMRVITQTTLHARAGCSVISFHMPAMLFPVLAAAASMQRPDLCNTARSCSVLMAHVRAGSELFAALLGELVRLSTAPSWRLRGGLLPPVALLFFRGQFIEPVGTHVATARSLLRALMLDGQQEVREAATAVFAGFVRIIGAPERELTLKWARSLSRKGKGLPLASRHAGVLALSSLVQLAPYDIPAWLPEVLELLATFFDEPQPIKGVVVKTFADFKRTHTDNWAVQRERFTPDQQELIADMLTSPSFYA